MKLYCCGIGYQHDPDFKVYTSIDDLKRDRSCWKECGIVEIVVDDNNVKWIFEQKCLNKEMK